MPHYRTTIDPPGISITGAALGPDVWPSLKMARAALDDGVRLEITQATYDFNKGVEALKLAYAERVRDLRASRDAALKVREADLPQDAAAAGTADNPVFGKPHGHGVDPNADDEAA